jgi:AcrR family transcriptional regulator
MSIMMATVRKPGPERREEIARAVLRIIGERGLRTLKTSTLASEVGLTSGALYRHFASLEEILIETARCGVRRIDATFPDAALPPLDRILRLAENRVRLLRDDRGLAWLLRSEQAYLALPEQAAQTLRDVAGRSRQFLLDALVDGAAAGSIRRDIEPEVLLVTVLGTIHALIGAGDPHPTDPARSPARPDRVLAGLTRMLQPPGFAGSDPEDPIEFKKRHASKKETES